MCMYVGMYRLRMKNGDSCFRHISELCSEIFVCVCLSVQICISDKILKLCDLAGDRSSSSVSGEDAPGIVEREENRHKRGGLSIHTCMYVHSFVPTLSYTQHTDSATHIDTGWKHTGESERRRRKGRFKGV